MSEKKKTAALFPGQGSQVPGMSKALVENFTWTKEFFEEASDTLKEDVYRLCAEGPADILQLTANAQPCILVTSYAWFQVLRETIGFEPTAGAGHSLGEYSALVAAGAMTLAEAVSLVRRRGELMQSAVPKGKGKMAAVLGLADEKVRALCEAATEGENSLVVPANFNAPSQVVIAGHAEAVDRAQALASHPDHADWKARKFIPLNVSAPFHCPLMKQVAEQFSPYLKSVAWKTRTFPVVANLDGKLRAEGDLLPLLRDQIDHPVLWTDCVKTLEAQGISAFIEMGPGKVLTGLVKRIAENPTSFSVESVEDIKNLEKWIKE